MAPWLPPSKLEMIRDMIQSESLTTSQMAAAAEFSELSVISIRSNIRLFRDDFRSLAGLCPWKCIVLTCLQYLALDNE
jgi:hypothetical protein